MKQKKMSKKEVQQLIKQFDKDWEAERKEKRHRLASTLLNLMFGIFVVIVFTQSLNGFIKILLNIESITSIEYFSLELIYIVLTGRLVLYLIGINIYERLRWFINDIIEAIKN